jgi:hypothetical protein
MSPKDHQIPLHNLFLNHDEALAKLLDLMILDEEENCEQYKNSKQPNMQPKSIRDKYSLNYFA